ncbi:MAG TPA: GWxTD domain-containing protein [Thermoanaerobaculia bacterium]|nr:GWxTD domain-containing protein [Thermoanaerobaculia bacterium]
MKRLLIVTALTIAASPVPAQSMPELFQKVKAEVKGESWQAAMKTMDTLEAEAAKPGNEDAQKKLQSPLAFYRGVCEANLGQTVEAKANFEKFLADQPNVHLDPSMYSKKAIAVFEDARTATEAAAPAASSPGSHGSHGLFTAFQEFKAPPNSNDPVDERWASGPVQWIMTSDEKKAWDNLQAGADRLEFVDKFWESRNPNPGSPDNVFKTTFERRVAFADVYFNKAEEKRGSLTDRGMVFVLLGPPTYSGRRPIKNGEDASEENGMSTVNSASVSLAMAGAAAASPSGKLSSGQAAAIADRMTGPGTQAAENSNNYQEVWHYRKELLPKNIGYLQVDVTFVTKQGYGVDVLQRDTTTLMTLAASKKATPK